MPTRKIIHIDMDCFYAAIETRENPDLADKPVAVGGVRERGVIATCNYIARDFGVHSAMATQKAYRLCPDLIVLPPRMSLYREVSQAIKAIFHEFTHKVEPLSLDEAYLEVTDCQKHQGSATLIAKAIKQKVKSSQHITASAGVAPNKFLAKIASDWCKPDGLFVITPADIEAFMLSLPVNKLPGVGKTTQLKLASMAIDTCGELQKIPLFKLIDTFGKFGVSLHERAFGIDHRSIESHSIRKSLSVEETFLHDLTTLEDCLDQLDMLWNKLNKRLSYKNKAAHIGKQFIKLKFNDFTTTTVERKSTSLSFTRFAMLIEEGFARKQKPIRLMGLGVRFEEHEKNPQASLSFT